MKQLKKQISEKEKTTSKPSTSLLTFNGFPTLSRLLRGLISAFLLIFLISFLSGAISEGVTNARAENVEETAYVMSVRERSTQRLIQEVDSYIKTIAPTTKLDASIIVDLCEKYEMDISFVIAQGILESHLGTKGQAKITNSVWNVGTYDNGIIHYTYKDPNESIEPYLKLLKKNYLIRIQRGDTISREIRNLIQDNGFVNYKGNRYASSAIYENSLRNMILKVQMESRISVYQGISEMQDQEIIFNFSPQAPDSILIANL